MCIIVIPEAMISGAQFRTLKRSYKGDLKFLDGVPGQAFAVAAII